MTIAIATTHTNRRPWLMLPARLLLFACGQALLALGLALQGTPDAWLRAGAWWPVTAVLANLVCIGLLRHLYRQEGRRYRDLFRLQRQTAKKDLLILLASLLLAGPIAFLPNVLAATWLFGNQQEALDLLMQPLPLWGLIIAAIAFPLTIALAELPTYFAYALPRLEAQTGQPWLAVLLPVLFLAAQHCTLPLLWDARFIAWRLLMYLPFALSLGLLLRWRPQLLPYLVVVHGLMDLAAVLMIPVAG